MPPVRSRGLSLLREGDGRPCIIDHKTLNAMLFHLWGAADRRPVCLRMNIFTAV